MENLEGILNIDVAKRKKKFGDPHPTIVLPRLDCDGLVSIHGSGVEILLVAPTWGATWLVCLIRPQADQAHSELGLPVIHRRALNVRLISPPYEVGAVDTGTK